MSNETGSVHSRLRALRVALTIFVGAYALALALYLLLRLLFGDRFWWLAFVNTFAYFLFLPWIIFLPLTVLFRARRALVMALPLAVIGLLWIGPYFLPKPNSPESGLRLRVVTFNIRSDNAQLSAVEAWVRQVNADIVLLQDVPPGYGNQAVPELKDLYPYQANQTTAVRQRGNLILSRYPFETTDNIDIGNGLTWEALSGHSLDDVFDQKVTLRIDGTLVAIYNIHLTDPVGEYTHFQLPINFPGIQGALRYNDKPRNTEIQTLLTRLETETEPFIVAGDFNTSDQSVIYSDLAAHMRDSFREAGIGLGGSWPLRTGKPFSFLPPFFRIDYVWHSQDFRAIDALQGPVLGSDHLPLYVTLELRRKSK